MTLPGVDQPLFQQGPPPLVQNGHGRPDDLLAQYRIAYENIVRLDERQTEYFKTFSTTSTALVAFLAAALQFADADARRVLAAVPLVGLGLAGAWIHWMRVHRRAVRLRYRIIEEIEGHLPVRLFGEIYRAQSSQPTAGRDPWIWQTLPALFGALNIGLCAILLIAPDLLN